MEQSKIDSHLEAVTNILIGAGIALLAQLFWFPVLGKEFTLGENLAIMAFFTAVSYTRSYSLRRLFNGRSVYESLFRRSSCHSRRE